MVECPKYSVIVPIYNAQATLNRCVDSILDQNFDDMELILINDGSPDRCGEICGEYARKDSRVRYFAKPNGGVSTARNMGLDLARGTYVLFVDSDDYVSQDYFDVLEQVGEEFDFVMFSHKVTDGKTVTPRILTPFSSSDMDQCVKKFCETWYTKTLTHLYTKRYRRSMIEQMKLRFPENLYLGEDKTFNVQYIMGCRSCRICPEPLYWINVENENSLSRKFRPDLYEQLAMLTEQTGRTLREARIPEAYRREYQAAENLIQLRGIYSEAKRMHLMGRKRKERRRIIRQMCRQHNGQNAPLPKNTMSRLLKIPVWLNLAAPIDWFGWYLSRR